jgi:hypothetical protein
MTVRIDRVVSAVASAPSLGTVTIGSIRPVFLSADATK